MSEVSISTTFWYPVDVFEKPMQLWVFDLIIKFINYDINLIRKLWGIAVYDVVKLKMKKLLAFFLVLFSFRFVTTQNFLKDV